MEEGRGHNVADAGCYKQHRKTSCGTEGDIIVQDDLE